jgi:transposase InsO family protein
MNVFFLSALGLPISVQARFSNRSRSSFYYKPKKPERDRQLLEIIRPIHEAHSCYGAKAIADDLKSKHDVVINHKCVARIMKRYEIHSKRTCRKHQKNQYNSTDSSHPNRMKDIEIKTPDLVWSADFTHITYQHKTLYIATVLDTYTREVLGWHIATNHTVGLVLEALRMAIGKRGNKTPLMFHSDHGSEYISAAFLAKLQEYKITPSNSQKGKPWQNGIQESFYRTFKVEFGNPNRFEELPYLIEGIGQHFKDYDTERVHRALRMPPSMFYERQKEEQKRLKAAS